MGCLLGTPSHVEVAVCDHSRPLAIIGAHSLGEVRLAPGVFVKLVTGSFHQDYTVVKLLGSGAFGMVFQAKHTQSGAIRAVKEIPKEKAVITDGTRRDFIQEVEILAKVDHPNIAKVLELYEDEYKFAVVSEFVAGGELFSYIVKNNFLTESKAAMIMTQLLSALRYLHKCDIVHRDLKPENILLAQETQSASDLNIKLIDFGASASSTKNLQQIIGSLPYIAPEVLKQDYNEKCDIWSAGCILHILLSGIMPFYGSNDSAIINQIKHCNPAMVAENWKNVSKNAKRFVGTLLRKDPNERPSAEEALDDPWLRSFATNRIATDEALLAIDDLRKFCSSSKLQQAISLFVATYVLTREEKQHLTDVFSSLDTDHNGVLSKDELVMCFSQKMSTAEAQAQVEKIIAQVDMDASGTVNYTEFLATSIAIKRQWPQNAVLQAFQLIDTDKSGRIDIEELKALLGAGLLQDESLWKSLIASADKNQDGEIDIEEFVELLRAAYE